MFKIGERVLCIRNNGPKEFDKLIGKYGVIVNSLDFYFGKTSVQFDIFSKPVLCDANEIMSASEDILQYDIAD